MFVGICRLSFYLPDNRSLKNKRSAIKKIIERTRVKFNVSVAEVGANDEYQKAVVAIAVIGNDSSHVDSMLAKISSFMESLGAAVLVSKHTEVISMGKELVQEVDFDANSDDIEYFRNIFEE